MKRFNFNAIAFVMLVTLLVIAGAVGVAIYYIIGFIPKFFGC